ncbi:MAG TPA: metal-dependent hydrolase [Chthoniobacterales bacterium]|nr:metal-dependent hydrolase [Chthoniobacterales bacterium]
MATQTRLTFYGQASYKLETPRGNVALIDPWITNPKNPNGQKDVDDLKKVDLILLTHGHADHVGNSVEIAKRTGAKLVSNLDLATAMISVLGYPEKQAGSETNGHIGGTVSVFDGEAKVTVVPACHGSYVQKDDGSAPVFGGPATGLVIEIANGPTIYHTGDTDVFNDMRLIGEYHKIDWMLCCIGDHFTMGPKRAAHAVELVNPRTVVPNHYGTFPLLTGTPEAFEKELKARGVKSQMRVMEIGETISL